jgi:8-oxo-dGTP pyrophosphatase MutT (NUDIX family)
MSQNLIEFVDASCSFDPADTMLPFTVDGVLTGWMRRAFAERLNEWPEYFSVRPRGVGMPGRFESAEHRSAAIAEVVESLAVQTVIGGWRGELVTVAESFHAPPLFHLERAASRYFGVTVYGAHLNGITDRDGEPHMWIAERAMSKDTDPGKLDNMVAGRITRGMTPMQTLIKECGEEAGMDVPLARRAKAAGAVRSRREVEGGFHHEVIFVHDLVLAPDFVPQNKDGEVASFSCQPLREVIAMIESSPGRFTPDAALTILDFLIRRGNFTAERGDYLRIVHAMRP